MKESEPTDRELFADYHAHRDEAIRNRVVERYAGLAVGLSRRFEHRGVPLDDLVQIAHIGVLKAVERFDPAQGAKFTTFATPTVLGEIKRYFRDKTWAVRVPRSAKDLHIQVAPAVGELHRLLHRSPTIAEIAEHLGSSEESVLQAMEAGAAYRSDSIDDQPGEDDRPSLVSRLGAPDAELERAATRVSVRTLMAELPERERSIVYLRYFEDLTQAEIADRVGLSQVHVSRLLRQALARLGQKVQRRDEDP